MIYLIKTDFSQVLKPSHLSLSDPSHVIVDGANQVFVIRVFDDSGIRRGPVFKVLSRPTCPSDPSDVLSDAGHGTKRWSTLAKTGFSPRRA
jgi:hypothetical protein